MQKFENSTSFIFPVAPLKASGKIRPFLAFEILNERGATVGEKFTNLICGQRMPRNRFEQGEIARFSHLICHSRLWPRFTLTRAENGVLVLFERCATERAPVFCFLTVEFSVAFELELDVEILVDRKFCRKLGSFLTFESAERPHVAFR